MSKAGFWSIAVMVTLALGCTPEASDSERREMPAVAQAHFNQLSAGSGARVYSFSVAGEAFAQVLITGDRVEGAYAIDREYWRMDPDFDLDGVETFRVDVAWGGWRVTTKTMQHVFEKPTKGWTAWEVPRGFTIDQQTTVVADAAAEGRHLFSVYGPAPAGLLTNSDVDTFLEYHLLIDTSGSVPVMCWILSADSFATFEAARAYVSDESTTIVSKWGMRDDAREVLFFGAAKALRIEQGEGFIYSAVH